jgi:hypothetical protein
MAVPPLTAPTQIIKPVRRRPPSRERTGPEITSHQNPPNSQGEPDQIPNPSIRHSLPAASQRLDRPQPSSEQDTESAELSHDQ